MNPDQMNPNAAPQNTGIPQTGVPQGNTPDQQNPALNQAADQQQPGGQNPATNDQAQQPASKEPFYQQRYQDLVNFLNKRQPEVVNEFRHNILGGENQQQFNAPAAPAPAPVQAPSQFNQPDDPTLSQFEDLTTSDLPVKDLVKLLSQTVEQKLEADRQRKAQEEAKRVAAQQAFEINKEAHETTSAVEAWIQANNIPKDIIDKAFTDVEGYGINIKSVGGPTRFMKAFVDRIVAVATMNQMAGAPGVAQQVNANQAAAALVAQPNTGHARQTIPGQANQPTAADRIAPDTVYRMPKS